MPVASAKETGLSPAQEKILGEQIAQFVYDPLGYVMFAFPWGMAGTDLEHHDGPDKWQAEQLMAIGEALKEDPRAVYREATASGHGIGKSAETSFVILWAMSTQPMMNGWVTANTQEQLRSKTWRELSIWHGRAINGHWFDWTATAFTHKVHGEKWQVRAIPWSEHNSESFAGTHNIPLTLLMMDEASAVADIIWQVADGAETDGRVLRLAYGNPTKNTGAFRECFGKFKHRWNHRQIDSRTCKMTDKVLLEQWKDDWGEDSDRFRVRVRGEFPRHGTGQLISGDDVQRARATTVPLDEHIGFSIIIGVDVARFGGDESVITIRQGRRLLEQRYYNGLNNIQLASRVIEIFKRHNSVGVMLVDEIGVGAGVVDYIRTLGYPCIGVNAGAKADDDTLYYNKRAEMWGRMREWIEGTVDIPDDPILGDQLSALEYEYDTKERIKLEKKDDLKERLPELGSPDRADSLALTFAEVVVPAGVDQSFEPEEEMEY